LSQAKDAIRRSEFVVVVEGNMDVISSHQAGVCEAVATAGTAMTEMHLKSFARMTNDIRLAYDGDEAGVRAAERAISMASKFGIYLSVIDDYHGCKDADELIQKDPALWQKATQSYRPALEWLLEKYEGQYNLRTEKGFAEYAAAAKTLIDDVEDAVLREKYERIVSDRLGISLEAFRAKKVVKAEKKMKKNVAVKGDKAEISRAEKNLAALVKNGPVALDDFEPAAGLDDDELALIFDELYAKLDKAGREREAKNLLKKVMRERLEAERAALAEAIRVAEEAEDDEKVDELLREMQKLDKKLG
jgi:DNA primase